MAIEGVAPPAVPLMMPLELGFAEMAPEAAAACMPPLSMVGSGSPASWDTTSSAARAAISSGLWARSRGAGVGDMLPARGMSSEGPGCRCRGMRSEGRPVDARLGRAWLGSSAGAGVAALSAAPGGLKPTSKKTTGGPLEFSSLDDHREAPERIKLGVDELGVDLLGLLGLRDVAHELITEFELTSRARDRVLFDVEEVADTHELFDILGFVDSLSTPRLARGQLLELCLPVT